MDAAKRLERLQFVLEGTGAKANDAYGIWAAYSSLSDQHIEALDDWADLEYLVANDCRITDHGFGIICRFKRLQTLGISATAITHLALVGADWPPALQSLGLAGLPLNDDAVAGISRLAELSDMSINYTNVTDVGFEQLARLPRLRSIEVFNTAVTFESAQHLSNEIPELIIRHTSGVLRGGKFARRYSASDS